MSDLIDISSMSYPMQCTRCANIHDVGTVTVVQRYSDCTTWRCPGCKSLINDRPEGWGGSARRIDQHTARLMRDGYYAYL